MVKGGAYKFTSKKQSLKGIMSTVFSVLSLASLLVANVISFSAKGEVDSRMGASGLLGMVFALAGFFVGVSSLKEVDVFRFFPRLGFVLGLIACVLWAMIFGIGMGL